MPPLYKKLYLIVLSLLAIGLNIGRCPDLLLHPRFFAEEGSTYFAFAYQTDFIDNLLTAHYGYYTLYNQLATSLATYVPLDHAPLVTTLLALCIQIGISLYVLWGNIPLLQPLLRRSILAIAIPLISWPGHWLTIIGSQCWLGAGTFLLLLSVGRSGRWRSILARGSYLLLAGLTGVVSCFLLPAYLWRAVKEKSKEFAAYSTILGSCLLLQGGVLLAAYYSRSPDIAARFTSGSPVTALGKTIVYLFATPFTGRAIYEQRPLVELVSATRSAVENLLAIRLLINDLFLVPVMVGIAICIALLLLLWQNRSRLEMQLIAISLVSVCALSNLCSVNSSGGPRYYFIPSLILLCLLLAEGLKRHRLLGAVTSLLLLSTLLANGLEFRSVMYRQVYHPHYPNWHTEVMRWRQSPTEQLNIWPANWTMALNRDAEKPLPKSFGLMAGLHDKLHQTAQQEP